MALGLLGILGLGGVGAGIAGGLGYGFGIRYGFERIFPSFQQGGPRKAIETAANDIAQLLGTEGFDAGSAETDTFLGRVASDDNFNPGIDPGSKGSAISTDDLTGSPSQGRREGATELRGAVSESIDTLANPFTRVEIVQFGNYKRNAQKIATVSPSNQGAKNQTWIPALKRAQDWINANSSFQRYYDWLTG